MKTKGKGPKHETRAQRKRRVIAIGRHLEALALQTSLDGDMMGGQEGREYEATADVMSAAAVWVRAITEQAPRHSFRSVKRRRPK